MAEHGAHITVTIHDKPSIFDLVAQETMLESLQPAFKSVLKVLAEKNPSKFSKCFTYADELFFFIHSLLQLHYLSNYSASFSENFYDLRRVPLRKTKKHSELNLPLELVYKSFVSLTLVPYIKCKMNDYYQLIEERSSQGAISQKAFKQKMEKVIAFLWPKIHLCMELATLVYYLRYLTGKGKVHSPLLHSSGVCLAKLSEHELEFIEQHSSQLRFSNIKSFADFGWWAIEVFGSGLQNSLEIGAFFLQFLDWFYSTNSSRKLFASGPIPPPPSSKNLKTPLDSKMCPICQKERSQETVLSVSGYVFCYGCILSHVRTQGTCPVTRYPASVKQLIRIYHD